MLQVKTNKAIARQFGYTQFKRVWEKGYDNPPNFHSSINVVSAVVWDALIDED